LIPPKKSLRQPTLNIKGLILADSVDCNPLLEPPNCPQKFKEQYKNVSLSPPLPCKGPLILLFER